MTIIWHNGQWIEDAQAVFSINDRVRYGDGVFDTLLCTDGHPKHISQHFLRLQSHAAVLGLEVPLSEAELLSLIKNMIKRNEAYKGTYALNIILTRGEAMRGLGIPEKQNLNIALKISPCAELNVRPDLWISKTVRRNEGSPVSRIKSFQYLDNILALREAKEHGAQDVLLLNNQGNLTCASTANVFIVSGGRIYTPPLEAGVIDGIARGIFMKAYAVSEKQISFDEILQADEIILTNSLRGAVFAKSINGHPLNSNCLGIDKNFHLGS